MVADAVRCIATVSGHLRKRSLLAAAKKAAPLLRHSAPAVRYSTIAFVAAAARCVLRGVVGYVCVQRQGVCSGAWWGMCACSGTVCAAGRGGGCVWVV